jgi:hypothetical protein
MAKSYKQQKTKEKFSKDVVDKQRKKARQFGKGLANNYINFDEEIDDLEEEEYEQNYS